MPLNAKQQRFVAEYLKDLNATQAAIRAGYKSANADVTGPRLLGNVGVAAAIEAGQAKIAGKLEITAERVLAELALLGFSNMQDFASVNGKGTPSLDLSGLDRDQWAAVSQIKVDDDGAVTLKLYDKRVALVDLGKHLGLFKENPLADADDTELTPERQEARLLLLALELMNRRGKTGASVPAPTKH